MKITVSREKRGYVCGLSFLVDPRNTGKNRWPSTDVFSDSSACIIVLSIYSAMFYIPAEGLMARKVLGKT